MNVDLEQLEIMWRPRRIFRQCCVKWLAHGPSPDNNMGHHMMNHLTAPHHQGCNGKNCDWEHPKIVLKFENGHTIASIEHLLFPFTSYFQKRCEEGTATPIDATTWQLISYIRDNTKHLLEEFAPHLVEVKVGAQDLSDQAQIKELQQEQQEEETQKTNKRSKISHPTAPELLVRVLEICDEAGFLQDYWDCVDIAWMRTLCQGTQTLAARLATRALRQQHEHGLSFMALVDGNNTERRANLHHSDSPPEDLVDMGNMWGGGFSVRPIVYYPAHNGPTRFVSSSMDTFVPPSLEEDDDNNGGSIHSMHWDSGRLTPEGKETYRGHKICVYQEPPPSPSQPEQQNANIVQNGFDAQTAMLLTAQVMNMQANGQQSLGHMFTVPSPTARKRVARFEMDPESDLREPGLVKLKATEKWLKHASLTIRVLESNVEQQSGSTRYSGTFKIVKLDFGFACLITRDAQARYKDAIATAEKTMQKRPLMERDMGYLNEIEKIM